MPKELPTPDAPAPRGEVGDYDVIVIGAGVSGLYALHRLREAGLRARVFEAGRGVGGTWYWNRYPGARFDSESYSYQYSFSEELLEAWDWSEEFAAQPEIERYLNHVADRFELRRDIELEARVRRACFDERERRWEVEIEDGRRARARFLVAATGIFSAHHFPDYPGVEHFEGLSLHTARWPEEDVELAGRRVGVIGTGPTAVQLIQTIAPEVAHLTVFQRTANWCTPLRNHPIDPEACRQLKRDAAAIFELCNRTFGAFIHQMDERAGEGLDRAERWAKYEQLYQRGGFALWLGNYSDVFTSHEVADDIAAFLAEKIRERVNDPEVAEKLIPKSHTFGTKRPPGEKDYYEAFNLEHVELVDLHETPIRRITPRGVETTRGHHDLDALVYATGFHTLTGALMQMEIVGRGGRTLRDHWSDGPRTNLGVQFAGFPNLFAVLGPHNPGSFCNIPRCAETNVEWIVDCIRHVRDHGYASIEPTLEAEAAWTQACYESAEGLLIGEMQDSWFYGTNNPENVRGRLLIYAGSVPAYREIFREVAAKGYQGFELR